MKPLGCLRIMSTNNFSYAILIMIFNIILERPAMKIKIKDTYWQAERVDATEDIGNFSD